MEKQSKNGRLHEFQAQLLERMNAARNGSATRESRLGIAVSGRQCLLDLHEAEEIVHPMPITPVPLTKDWYLGLANVRGDLISVIDLDRFCGARALEPGKNSRVVVLQGAQSGMCGFLVAGVLGLRYLQDMVLQPSCPLLCAWPFGRHYLDQDQGVWSEISLMALISDSRFLHVAL